MGRGIVYFKDKLGIEIGGPSIIFSRHGWLPAYATARRIDNCNFSSETTWNKSLIEGMTFKYDVEHSPGRQYIADTINLEFIASETYDFILSSHVLEHIANPIKALLEWIRVIREEGTVVCVVPHKQQTFDHNRPVTALAHIIEDFEKGTEEDDLTHLPEILELHDLALDPPAGTFAEFKRRSEQNVENRCLHQHVFDTALLMQLVHYANLEVCSVKTWAPMHIMVVARKMQTGQLSDKQTFFRQLDRYCSASIFPFDRQKTKMHIDLA